MTTVHTTSQLYQAGDRVRISKEVTTIPALPSYIGTIKEVIPCYGDQTIGYNVSLDADPRASRTWFFFQHQLKASEHGK